MVPLMFILYLVVCVYIGFAESSDASENCIEKNILKFHDLARRDPSYVLSKNEKPVNDDNTSYHSWYGQPNVEFLITDDVPETNQCGSTFPIYIPEGPAITTSVTTRSSCTRFGDMPCEYKFKIRVMFCENLNYNIYQFDPKLPGSSYCVVLVNNQLNYRTTIDVTVPQPTEIYGEMKYQFLCEFDLSTDENFWYQVSWYVDNEEIKTFPRIEHSSTISDQTLLTEDMLASLGTTSLGFKIQCGYAVSLEEDTEQGFLHKTAEKYIGIELLTPTVFIANGAIAEITIRPTIPIGCITADPNCYITVNVIGAAGSNNPCDPTTSFSNCGITIPGADWDKTFTMTVAAGAAIKYGSNTAVNLINLKTSASFPSHAIWQNYDLVPITIRSSQDTSNIQGQSCHAICDPHMRTFSGRNYEHHYDGLFTLYENKQWKQEIQIKTSPCSAYGDGRPYCVCGMAIRVGMEVFVMDHCDPFEYWSIGYTQCGYDGVQLIDVTRDGASYEFRLPSGLTVETRVYSHSNLLNLYLYPSGADVTSWGLCGQLDHKPFTLRDGTTTPYVFYDMPTFSESWRVTDDMIDLFSDEIDELDQIQTGDVFCKCTTPPGSLTPKFTCEKVPDSCSAIVGSSQPVSQCDDYDLIMPRESDSSESESMIKRSLKPRKHTIVKRAVELDWRNGWTKQRATDYCNSLFTNSSLVKACKTVPNVDLETPLANCILDIQYMADASFALVAVETIASKCRREVIYDTTLHTAATPGQLSVLDQFKSVACPLDCSFRGSCINGVCHCNGRYRGSACSYDTSIPPSLYRIANHGYCDLQKGKCSDISAFGGDFIDPTTTVCKINLMLLTEGGILESKSESQVASVVKSLGEVKCSLIAPSRKRRSAATTEPEAEFVNVYGISVSNNGIAYSNSSLVVVFNSKCQFCTITGSSVRCNYTGDFCMSGGQCYGNGEPHLIHKCYTCSVNRGVRKWIRISDAYCDDGDNVPLIIALVLVAIVIISLAVVAFLIVKTKNSKVSNYPLGSGILREPTYGAPPPYGTSLKHKA